ncbi:alpha-L-arabinofuranosidase [Bombiscardovia apis]|uniref:non-reducing end alpha-L-arabinofuranosidase n=1 Tax=Bombiscardovia apis TaxID=2932182 RepID=A0ABN6SE60_9BIFI|nr:alpha-L-arabinofuranosidase C-terminal domain-containing protein [Bombiscardovia apis]BDR53949.1 alpha-L-arabinofuranosidase [Bombiscardovia apis]
MVSKQAGVGESRADSAAQAVAPDQAEQAALSFAGVEPKAQVPARIFGSFVEHLGRCVYGGIYEPGHPSADEDGFRQDVLDLVKELGVTCVRYPGGNFVSGYRWEDGTGPRELRPVRRDLAWHATESNQMGIDDFYRWSRKAGTEIMLAVNMGTRGLAEALDELEYVNGAPGTALADRRVRNGIPEPMGISMWCIGNEMDGPWQVGHMNQEEYAAAVERAAHAMKLVEPGLELVACGSSSAHMPTFGSWERTVLTQAYEHVDFVSCHAYYYERGAASLQDFLASSEDMEAFIATVVAAADDARAVNKGSKDIALSFDEWGVWNQEVWNGEENERQQAKGLHTEPWPQAPHQLEDIYTVADAVVEGSLMITLLSHADRVRSASRAQLVNVIAPIMAEEGGPAWKQTIFYPFAEAAQRVKGSIVVPRVSSPKLETSSYGRVDALKAVASWDQESGSGVLLMVNRDVESAHQVRVDVGALAGGAGDAAVRVSGAKVLYDADIHATNSAQEPYRVKPVELPVQVEADGQLAFELPAVSWAAIELSR